MERHTRLSRAAVVLVAIALIASIAAAVWFASPDAPYVPNEDSGAALGAAAPAEDGTVADQLTTVPSGYTGIYAATGFDSVRSGGRGTNGSSARYILMEDITVTSIDTTAWSGNDGNPWKGELDGNGYTITIDAATASGEYYDTGGLFSILGGGAKIYDLTVKITNIGVGSSRSSSFGMIAGTTCGEVTIDNVRVELNKNTNTMTLNSNNEGSSDAYLFASSQLPRDHSRLWLGGVIGKLETSSKVTISDTSVVNNAGGTYGFSVNTWTQGSSWGTNGDSHMYLGGFVGGITSGTLKIANCKYEGEGKLSAVAESTSGGRYPRAFVGGVLGKNGFKADEEGGTVSVEGFIFEGRANNWENLFYTENINYDDDDTVDNRGLIVGDDCHSNNMTLQGLYVNGQINVGHGNLGESSSSKLIGDNAYWGGMYQYMSPFSDAEFVDGGIVFELSKQNPTDDNIVAGFQRVKVVDSATNTTVNTPDENSKVDTLEDVLTSSDPTVWVRATFDKHGSDDYEIRPIYAVKDTYSVENYAAISSYDGSVYTGSKVYDEQILSTPYISVNNTTINAWTAPSGDLTNVGDGSAKVFTYDQSKLSGYTAVEYNGAVYLVNGTTVYSPSEIIVNGEAQTFVLGKNFSYTITPMPVTVTPNVPTTQLYEGGEMPELTVTSTVPADVEGTIAWDEGQTLSAEVTTYYWTWTPASSNYQTMKGSIYLTVFEKEITAIEVTTQPDKLYYVAYEAFDPAGIVVTATYSDGSSAPLSNDEYEFKVENGYTNKLIVGNNTVTVSLKKGSGASTTITITVSKLAVDVPIANQGLVYNGAEQIGVAASADNYYSLSGNTGTNAADYTATAKLNDKVNTRWDTDTEDDTADKSIAWSIAKENVAITVMHTSKIYDGQVVEPKTLFTAQGVNNEELALTVTVDGGKTILNAGTYSVTASLAESETNYTADSVTITYKVDKKLVSGEIVADNLVYDGTEKGATFNGQLIGEDKVEIKYAGDRINVTEAGFTATADLPSDNYAWADDTAPSETFMISPKEITVTATSGSREFNWNSCSEEELRALFTLSEAVDYKLFVNDEEAEIAEGQVSAIYDAKEYKIEIASANANYTLVGTTSTTYTITVKKVEKPIISDVREFIYNGGEQGFEIAENQAYEVVGDTKATDAYDGYIFTIRLVSPGNVAWSDDSPGDITVEWKIIKATFTSVTIEFADGALDNLFTSSAMPTPTTITANPTPLPEGVEGKFEWVESSLSEDTNTYHWTYTVPNYNVFEGTQELTAQAAVLESITLSGEYKTEYTAYDFFDIDNLVVTAHFSHGENQPGEDTPLALGEYTLTTASAQYDENGVPQLFVADDHVTVTYQGKSVQIDIDVAPKQIAVPTAATELVYDGTEKVGVTGSDGYTLSGDTKATDANGYSATAVLTDKDNTTWTDGTTDDKTIEWSIEKMVVSGEIVAPGSLVYDGSQKAVSFDGQLAGNDKFGIAYDGDRQNVTADGFTVTVSLPNDNNYEWADGVVTTAAYKISPKAVEIESTQELAKTYDGEAVAPSSLFTAPNGVNNEGALQLAFVITVDGANRDEILNAGTYSVTASLAESVTNYTAVPVTITFTIAKATLTTVTASAESDGLDTSDDLYAVPLNVKGVGVNGEEVSGTGIWASGQSLSEGTNNYKFVFTPDQEFAVNYEVCEGECEIANVAQATLTGVSVEIVATTEYVAFDAFDRSSIAVEALYGEDRKQVTDYTLTFSSGAEDRLLAGTGITVTVTYTDGDVTQYTEFTIDVAKRAVAKPVVDTTVFDATGETITLPIAASEYYTIDGNTAIEPGRYVATVELNDPANTMWEDGSVDDVSIAWTISEPVTSDEVIADILAMEKVTWQNAEEFLDLEARYNALDESEQTAEATAKLAVLRAQYDALRNAAFDDIEAAHEVTAKSLGKALAAAAAGLSAAAIALAIAKRRSI